MGESSSMGKGLDAAGCQPVCGVEWNFYFCPLGVTQQYIPLKKKLDLNDLDQNTNSDRKRVN